MMTIITATTAGIMVTTTDPTSIREGLSIRRALLATVAVLAIVAAACTGDGAADETTTTSPTGVTTTQPSATSTTVADVDVAALLQRALASYEDGYQFEASVTVADQDAATVSGIVAGDDAQMTVASGDGTATYVITQDASWARIEDGDWEEVESDGPFDPPLAPLAAPNTIAVVSISDGTVNAVAAYDGDAFGTEGQIDMHLVFVDGMLIAASYEAGDASATTTFSPLDGATVEIPGTGA